MTWQVATREPHVVVKGSDQTERRRGDRGRRQPAVRGRLRGPRWEDRAEGLGRGRQRPFHGDRRPRGPPRLLVRAPRRSSSAATARRLAYPAGIRAGGREARRRSAGSASGMSRRAGRCSAAMATGACLPSRGLQSRRSTAGHGIGSVSTAPRPERKHWDLVSMGPRDGPGAAAPGRAVRDSLAFSPDGRRLAGRVYPRRPGRRWASSASGTPRRARWS